MLVKCPKCKGAKKMVKLGAIEGDCNECQGAGVIKKEEAKIEPVESIDAKGKSKKG